MSKKLLLIIGLGVLLIGGSFGFWYYKSRSTQSSIAPEDAATQAVSPGTEVAVSNVTGVQDLKPTVSGASANPISQSGSAKIISSESIPQLVLLQGDAPQEPMVMYQGRTMSKDEFNKAWAASSTKVKVEVVVTPVKPIPSSDLDKDGLTYDQELKLGTDPNNADTDGDGLVDGKEVDTYKTNPKNFDSDSDGLTDGEEVDTYKTNPLKVDTDGDSFSDGIEVKGGYNPLGSGKLKL